MSTPRLLAVSDLHVRYDENRQVLEALRPVTDDDWLIVAGDVADRVGEIVESLDLLRRRFAKVIWVPGNHDLWTHGQDESPLRGDFRYRHLVEVIRALGVLTPEDPYPVWEGEDGPVVVAPLFLLYDYSFLPAGTTTSEEGLAAAHTANVVCTDEYLLHPDPYPSRTAWSHARIDDAERRLMEIDPQLPTVLVNHWPMTRLPTRVLRYPEFALWCGSERTADWHVRFRAAAVVYGHLHIPRVTVEDGVRFVEASLGYPREWKPRVDRLGMDVTRLLPRQILPAPREP